MKKAQSALETALILGFVVIVAVSCLLIYNGLKTKLADMSKVTVTTPK